MEIKINDFYGQMELEKEIRSIFDASIAGQIAEDGKYYIIHVDHKTHKKYALTSEAQKRANALGYPLDEGQEAIFNGEKVRGMTFDEEIRWNENALTAHVDLWGNIATEGYVGNC